jgi:hypothetical protein
MLPICAPEGIRLGPSSKLRTTASGHERIANHHDIWFLDNL